MEQMGFSICCLTCDAPDVAGTERCRGCIASHAKARDNLTSGPSSSKADRLAREFVSMLADPGKSIDDAAHGELMIYYQKLINLHQGDKEMNTLQQVEERFNQQRSKEDRSLIRDVANQNPWANNPPSHEEREEMLALFDPDEDLDSKTWDDLIAEVGELLDDED